MPGGVHLSGVKAGVAQFQGRTQCQPGMVVADPSGAKPNLGNLQVGEGFVAHGVNFNFNNGTL